MEIIINFIFGLVIGMIAAFLEHYFGFKRWFSMMIAILLGLIIWVLGVGYDI